MEIFFYKSTSVGIQFYFKYNQSIWICIPFDPMLQKDEVAVHSSFDKEGVAREVWSAGVVWSALQDQFLDRFCLRHKHCHGYRTNEPNRPTNGPKTAGYPPEGPWILFGGQGLSSYFVNLWGIMKEISWTKKIIRPRWTSLRFCEYRKAIWSILVGDLANTGRRFGQCRRRYKVFIKYCVFPKILEYSELCSFPCCQCVNTHQAGRTPALQQNWQSSEK